MTTQDSSSPDKKDRRPQSERANVVIDWPAIELLYRLGALSTRQIAAQHGITEGAIRQKAQKLGWTRDYAAAVRDATAKAAMWQDAAKVQRAGQGGKADSQDGAVSASTHGNGAEGICFPQGDATHGSAQHVLRTKPPKSLSEAAIIQAAASVRVDVIGYHKGIASKARAIAATLMEQLEARVADTPDEVAKNAITLGALTKSVRDIIETERRVYGIDDARDDESSRPTYTIRREIIDVTPARGDAPAAVSSPAPHVD